MRPFQHRAPGELLAVVRPDVVGIAAMLADAIEYPHQVIATQGVFGMDSNTFGGRIIDDAEDLELAPIRDAVEGEVHRSDRVG